MIVYTTENIIYATQNNKGNSYLKDLKAGNVQDTNEACTLSPGAIQRLVEAHHNPLEHALIESFSNGLNSKLHLWIHMKLTNIITAVKCKITLAVHQEMLLFHGTVFVRQLSSKQNFKDFTNRKILNKESCANDLINNYHKNLLPGENLWVFFLMNSTADSLLMPCHETSSIFSVSVDSSHC